MFNFNKIVKPNWCFNLLSELSVDTVLVDYEKLQLEDRMLIDFDNEYSCIEVSKLDAAYQALLKGILYNGSGNNFLFRDINPTVVDNYRFIKKYYHSFWVFYVFMIRLFTLRITIFDFIGVVSTFRIKRLKLFSKVKKYEEELEKYESVLLENAPRVSVIIPTLNRYEYLRDVILDLEAQDYKNFDVIIVDQSDPPIAQNFEGIDLDLKYIVQKDPALWRARNYAVKSSDASFFLLFDDDSRVSSDWIRQHLVCMDYFNADISSGVSIALVGAPVPQNYSFYRLSDQLDTGNVMIRRSVFEKTGLFDLQFEKQRQGDGEFGVRAFLNGFKNISNPRAKRLHLKVSVGGLRDMGHWDGFRPKSWLAPRPIPSVLYLTRKYYGNMAGLYLLLVHTPPSIFPYRFKKWPKLIYLMSFLIIPIFPIVIVQLIISWRKSSEMIKVGALIENLE